MPEKKAISILVQGIVQGVGFRPFIYNLAKELNIKGWVRNTSAGVDIHLEGPAVELDTFLDRLKNNPPPLALIDYIEARDVDSEHCSTFEIVPSKSIVSAFQPISPDVSICEDCLRELFDPQDRRYLYPFINCTNCGPRFTIIQDIPYDRPKTTMSKFALCNKCDEEYKDPTNRRFHAQPVACPVCGPHIWLEIKHEEGTDFHKITSPNPSTAEHNTTVIRKTQELLKQGKIVAIKGLGGFHLACDATNQRAVQTLRQRKMRVEKPFALMLGDIASVRANCELSEEELQAITSRQRPIVLLKRKPSSKIRPEVAPGQNSLGVMLPYTPLHYLLFAQLGPTGNDSPPFALVMTSGNLSEEPIAKDNQEARERLLNLSDAFLMHNRPIYIRCDDSVSRVEQIYQGEKNTSAAVHFPLRRSRGYAPFPIRLPWQSEAIFAAGAELKNTFCLTREHYAFISHHIGDMENYETLQSFEKGIKHYERLFRINPRIIAYDKHPDYLATRYAIKRAQLENLPAYGIQHHHAHIAACLADNGYNGEEQVIGVSFDGTGFGDDGNIWGGEILLCNYKGYHRAYHLEYFPLPGGDKAIREPWRIALALLYNNRFDWTDNLAPIKYLRENSGDPDRYLELLQNQIETKTNTPLTSSMGRLFDAIASITGLRHAVNYEAQAAMELEALADENNPDFYPNPEITSPWDGRTTPISLSQFIQNILEDIENQQPIQLISSKFHNTIARTVLDCCIALREYTGIHTVALSGGVWQNMYLLSRTTEQLAKSGFIVLVHKRVPPNDGGIALGQAAIAAHVV